MVSHVNLGSLDLYAGSFSLGMEARGVMSESRWVIGSTQADFPVTLARFEDHRNGDVVIGSPGTDRHIRYFGATKYWALVITEAELQDFLDSVPGFGDIERWRGSRATMLRPIDQNVGAWAAHEIGSIIDAFVSAKVEPSPDAAQYWRRAVIDLAMYPAATLIQQSEDRTGKRAWALIRNVTDYMSAAGTRPVHVAELCSNFAVSRRTLFRAFEDRIGMSPIAYLRHKRLCDVRAALASGRTARVEDVAFEHGFADPSRFAGYYRRLFGELPSATLQRARL